MKQGYNYLVTSKVRCAHIRIFIEAIIL